MWDFNRILNPSMKQISIPNNNQIEISQTQVYHCDGLLLCVTKDDNSKLVVWNPYLGQTKLIPPRNHFQRLDRFAIGYDINRNHKILRFSYDDSTNEGYGQRNQIDVYDFSSDSWRVLDVNPNSDVPFHHTCVSLKGNTYFLGQEVIIVEPETPEQENLELTDIEDYLLCFDFTTESFGPRLPLPFNPPYPCFEAVILSWVRDEKLAALYNHYETPDIIDIWISTKIEPNAISWSTVLKIDTSRVIGLPEKFYLYFETRSFFIDEEKKVDVLFEEDGYFKSINIGVVPNLERRSGELVCSSYVPSLVQLQV